jgi:hypothetical protein
VLTTEMANRYFTIVFWIRPLKHAFGVSHCMKCLTAVPKTFIMFWYVTIIIIIIIIIITIIIITIIIIIIIIIMLVK